ncbi:rRNA processing protein Rrp12-like protein [Schizosaccharomyces octosporus yFS286]|uniref:rRNA processing protein Rrp12-like protein n=1 Tax=Schizosaccharomyces octosporus (strain yFS286) TaxID=483514 RepID=S9RA98_SCHOY|nr:rRNA processing protein Rrp12-like protein [Schizosaccharomyces octosporus yFS286]EPX71049.1 rRNA processing protein Rrp12-like protein [Schizosaccharomyces octosporus yFS286]
MSKSENFERMLKVIRSHTNGKLDNQRQPALLLCSVEEYITQKKLELSPIVYMSALTALILQSDKVDYSAVYLLSVVLPVVPEKERLAHVEVLESHLVPCLEEQGTEAPTIRCILLCIQEFLFAIMAQDISSHSASLELSLTVLLKYSIDSRPKIRKCAIQALQGVSKKNETSSSFLTSRIIALCSQVFRELNESPSSDKANVSTSIHCMQLLDEFVDFQHVSGTDLGTTTGSLVSILQSDIASSEFVVQKATSLLANLLSKRIDAIPDAFVADQTDKMLQSWERAPLIAILFSTTFASRSQSKGMKRLTHLFDLLLESSLADTDSNESKYAFLFEEDNGGLTEKCLTSALSNKSIALHVITHVTGKISKLIGSARSLRLKRTSIINTCCAFLTLLVKAARKEHMDMLFNTFQDLARAINQWKTPKSKEVKQLFMVSFEKFGVETTITSLAPINELSKFQRYSWLKDILLDSENNDFLEFCNVFIPVIDSGAPEWWSVLPAFCSSVNDPSALSEEVLKKMASTVYQQEKYREPIVKSFISLSKVSSVQSILSKNAANIIGVLGNVLASMPPAHTLAQCVIDAIVSIFAVSADKQSEVITTFIDSAPLSDANLGNKAIVNAFPSLLNIAPSDTWKPFLPHLVKLFNQKPPKDSQSEASSLNFGAGFAYRLLNACLSNPNMVETVSPFVGNLVESLVDVGASVQSNSKYTLLERFKTWKLLLGLIPKDDLHLMVPLISEATLASKDHMADVRAKAYELLVEMGNIMKEGGKIDRSRIQGADSNDETVQASLKEYFTMVSAGLFESTPTLTTCTILSLTRLYYEFRDEIDQSIIDSLMELMELNLSSSNQEVARTAVGFVKMIITVSPKETIERFMDSLMPSIFRWLKEHNAFVKIKAKQLLDRMLRIFTFNELSRYTQDAADKKWLERILQVRNSRAERKIEVNEEGIESENDEMDLDVDINDNNKSFNKADNKGRNNRQKVPNKKGFGNKRENRVNAAPSNKKQRKRV